MKGIETTMEIQVRGKGVVVTDALREYAQKKVSHLTHHFRDLRSAVVTQSIQGRMQRVEVQLIGDGLTIRGEDHHGDLYSAIDHVVDKLERRVQKYKERHRRFGAHPHHGDHDTIRRAPLKEDNEPEEEPIGRVVRNKRFDIKPIHPDEAIVEMELVGHDFFVFENADTGEVNVLYRRGDGNYGILEPER
jgi:putative sigma-54 modulation protein